MGQLGIEWIGQSVSTATLREEDLIPAFEEVLDQAGATYERPEAVNKLLAGKELSEDEWCEVSWYLNEDLFDALNVVAPDGTYFGAHPGDGADFGFWHCDEDGEPEEPEEGDYTTEDHIHWYQHAKCVLTTADPNDHCSPADNWQQQLKAHMAAEGFYPNVWFISDHGNAHRIELENDNG